MQSTVSVVVPTYNRAPLLRLAIASVCDSTHSDTEIIVVDDGSTDESGMLVGSLRGPIRYHYQSRRGLAAARNAGLGMAAGAFVLFLDSDDLITPDKLALQVDVLRHNPDVAAVYSKWEYVDRHGRFLVGDDGRDYSDDMLNALSVSNFAPIHSYLFRRSALEAIGGFSEDLEGFGYEDWDLLIRLAAAGVKFRFLPCVTARYRMHESNMCSISAADLCRCGLDVVGRLRRSGAACSETRISLAASLVHMEACSQLFRRRRYDEARTYGGLALRHHRDLAFCDMFFHYLGTFDAPSDIGHAAFLMWRRPSRELIRARYQEACTEWAADAGVRYESGDLARGLEMLDQWLRADAVPC